MSTSPRGAAAPPPSTTAEARSTTTNTLCITTKDRSTTAETSSITVEAISTPATAHRPVGVRMVQSFLLIWLDGDIDETNHDCRNTVTQLRRLAYRILTFTDADQCIQHIKGITDSKVCIIISDTLGPYTVPRVHDMSQVDSVFIFCSNKKRQEQWVIEWPKVKGVFDGIPQICGALKQVAQKCEQNAISISFVSTSGNASTKNLDQLDPTFMYSQILKEILLSIDFEKSHIKQFIDYCREQFADNDLELQNVRTLEKKYHDKTPVWWYTYESFLYPMLNRSLRMMDVDIIIRMGFFIVDLHRYLEQLHSEQFTGRHSDETFVVYRGQGLSKLEFEKMTQVEGGLLSFNNFLSTSKKREISFNFAQAATTNPDLVGILFEMTIDPSQSTTSFASINDVSYFEGEEELLFSMHSVFRVGQIKQINGSSRLFQVDLVLTDNNDQDLRVLTDRIREETFPDSDGWCRMGLLLFKMGHWEKAQQVYEVMLEQTADDDDDEKADIYHQLGSTKYYQGEYLNAMDFYQKSLEIREKTLPSNHPMLGPYYNNIGAVYDEVGEYSKALWFYEKDLEICKATLPPNDPNLAMSYNNIGLVYFNMEEYSKALAYYDESLEIRQKSLPPNHPDLGTSYNNIGLVYENMNEYSKALPFLEKALDIKQMSLLSNDPSLATSYHNIALAYENMGDHTNARSFYERAEDVGQRALTTNHPNLQRCRENMDIKRNRN
jgi:tetratricopeptide (TPR) repeat protein